MTKILNFIGLIGLILGISGCRGPDPNPELKDPIYLDLVSESKTLEGAIKSAEKEVEDAKKTLRSLPPRDPTRRQQISMLYSQEKKLLQLKQRAKYLKISQSKRKEYVRKIYPKFYEQNKPWPDENEFATYKKLKELRAAPKSWEERNRSLMDFQSRERQNASEN